MVFGEDKLIEILLEKLVDKGIKKIVESEMDALPRNMESIRRVVVDLEKKKIGSVAVAFWLAELREVLYDTEDLLDDFADFQRRKFKRYELWAKTKISKKLRDINSNLEKLTSIIPTLQLVATLPNAEKGSSLIIGTSLFQLDSDVVGINLRRIKTSTITKNINSNLSRLTTEDLKLLASQPNADNEVSRYNSSLITGKSSFQLHSDVVGFDDHAKQLANRITGDSNRAHSLFAITGMGGIGKTTLARKVFNHHLIQNHFQNKVWVCVSSNCTGEYLLKEIVRFFDKNYSESGVSLDELSSKLIEVVKEKRVFIVLDDIWDSQFWDKFLRLPLLKGENYSRILITTRNEKVAIEMNAAHTHPMTKMLQSDGWSMLCKIVFKEEDKGDMNKLEKVGKEIVDRCKCLPLAINVVGGVLRMTDRTIDAWTRVLSSTTWSMQDLPEDILPSLLLSYEDLPSHLKRCFIYCSLFPQDFKFLQTKLMYMWIAEGFVHKEEGTTMEESAKEYYNELVMRNLLQVSLYRDGSNTCKMHNLLHSLAIFVSQNQYIYGGTSSGLIKHRHLRFNVENMNVDPKEIRGIEHVRTLMLSTNTEIEEIPDELLSGLRRLRVLDLEGIKIGRLPEDSVGNMRQLRFLSISASELHMLPDSIENLENLETLMIASVLKSRSLPKGIGKLRNLRHLLVSDRLRNMPNGLDNLQKLRVLDCFVVNECTSSSTSRRGVWRRKKSEGCKPNMKELKDLSQLTDLSIHNLERVSSKEEAEEAAIEKKTSLKCLTLSCEPPPRISDEDIRKIEEVFAGIEIPENLTELSTDGFFGKQLPSLGNMSKLVNLHISGCPKLKSLGEGLSHATCLKKMTVRDLDELESIENMSSISELEISRNSSLRSVKNLPLLKKMNIENCSALRVVKDVGERSSLSISSDEEMTTPPTWSKNATDSEIVQPTVTDSEEIVRREENGILISEEIVPREENGNFPGASEIGHPTVTDSEIRRGHTT